MKWRIYLIIEMLVMIVVMLWIYFNPGDLEWNVVRSFFGFTTVYIIESLRNRK